MTISLPKELEKKIEQQISIPSTDPRFSEYVVNILFTSLKKNQPSEDSIIHQLLQEGIDSGKPVAFTKEEFTAQWEKRRQKAKNGK